MTLAARRVALYARFSSDRQSAASVEDQLARCGRWIEERGGRVRPELVFADRAVSAASMDRPGWAALERQIGAGAVDVIVVESLDRVSRKTGDTMQLVERLRFAGVVLHAIADGLDTSSRSAKVHTAIKGLVGDLYLDDLADKTRRGMEGRARAGLATGGLPYGYRSRDVAGGGRAIEIDPEQAVVVRRIFARYAEGASRNTIAAELNRAGVAAARSSRRDRARANTWQQTTVRAVLLNETYTGRWIWNRREWRKVPGTNRRQSRERPREEWVVQERPELAIVDATTWASVASRSSEEARAAGAMSAEERRGSGRRSYLLSGLLRCGQCDALMAVHGGGAGDRRYYRCSAASDRGTCSARGVLREATARRAFLEALRGLLTSRELLEDVRETIAQVLVEEAGVAGVDLGERREQLARLEAKIGRLVDALADGASPALAAKVRELEREQRSLRAEIATLERSVSSAELPSVDEVLSEWAALDELLAGADVARARERLRPLLADGSIRATQAGARFVLTSAILPPLAIPAAGTCSDHGIAGTRLTDIRAGTIPLIVEVFRAA